MCVGPLKDLFSGPKEPDPLPAAPAAPAAPPTVRPGASARQDDARQRQRQLAAYAATRSDRIGSTGPGGVTTAGPTSRGGARLLGETATV